MAFVQVSPITYNLSFRQGKLQKNQTGIVLDSTSTPVDFTTWDSFQMTAVPPVPALTGADTNFGTVTGNDDGTLNVAIGSSDLATKPPGTAQLIICGKPTSGDSFQILAQGALSVLAG